MKPNTVSLIKGRIYRHMHSFTIPELSLSLRDKLLSTSTDRFFRRARALESCKSNSRRI